MDFIRKNKFTIIEICCFLLLVVVLVQVKNIFFPNMGKAIYGKRLEGIESAKVTDDKLSTVKENLGAQDSISKVSILINGKIINVMLTVGDDLGLDQAKALSDVVYQEFSPDVQKFYDFQVFIQKKNGASNFPIIGYKHHNKENFSWTRDRTESAE